MNNQFYDLNIETLDDGTIRLEQRDYCGESMILDLHPAQVAYIADSLAVSTPERIQTQPNWATDRIATLERRMCWMRDRFEECYAALPSDMHKRCPEAPEFHAWLMASIDVATEFCADFPSKPFCSPFKAASELPGDMNACRVLPDVLASILRGKLMCATVNYFPRLDKAERKQYGND